MKNFLLLFFVVLGALITISLTGCTGGGTHYGVNSHHMSSWDYYRNDRYYDDRRDYYKDRRESHARRQYYHHRTNPSGAMRHSRRR